MMKVLTYPCGPIEANTYIIYEEGQGDTCMVIDPADGKRITKAIEDTGRTCTHILLTHGHFDHVWGVKAVKEATGAKVYISPADVDLISGKGPFFAAMQQVLKPFEADELISQGDTIEGAGLTLKVLDCPGHTKGGLSFVVEGENAVFTGDTLFRESIGRTDFPGGSIEELMDSVFNKLFTLPEETIVYPGHMGVSTIGHEKTHNILLRYKDHPWFN